MTEKYFVDSNVWLYLFTEDDSRKKVSAESFLDERTGRETLFISWQIINEVWANLLRKGQSDKTARKMIEHMLRSCELVDFSYDLIVAANNLRASHSVSFWDSLVVAAAQAADCDILVSEDMQDGKRFGTLRVKNIFTSPDTQ